MPRRPALGPAAAALCALLALTACQSSPEAGRPNTAPPATTATPTATGSAPSWTPEEQTAIDSAKARYVAARAAVTVALQQPKKASRDALEEAGNGGTWVIAVAEEVNFHVENGWYQSGQVKIVSTDVKSVKLDLPQPEVRLTTCLDSSAVVSRYQSNGKEVPSQGDDGDRHRFESRLVYAPSNVTGKKMWFLVEEKVAKTC